MKRFTVVAALAAAAALGLSGSSPAASGPHASGGGKWAGGSCNFGFAANEPQPGKVQGVANFNNCVGGYQYHAKVTCLRVEGNRATVGTVVTRSSNPTIPPGSGIVLYANDNGEPGKAGDQFWAHPEENPREQCPAPLMTTPLTNGNINVRE